MPMSKWREKAKCLGMDVNIFFDKYEEDKSMANTIDKFCRQCPVQRDCFAVGISNKEWGVWGGVYLKEGKLDKEFNLHKDKKSWFNTWQALTMGD
tara:strand:- start:339 stop:623 length:285 start_codon:yes stop_codon:yes gene_type:complete